MIELKSILVGLVFGTTCGLLNLPLPAPNQLAGVLGIVGVFIGYLVTK